MTFDLSEYNTVTERIREFYEKHPGGSLKSGSEPRVIEVNGSAFIAYHAQAFRTPEDPCPADGWAWEPVPGPSQFTKNSELMNAETSAWGRAIVALGFETKKIASAEEVRNRSEEPRPDGSLAGSSDNPAEKAQAAYQAAEGRNPPFSKARPAMTNEAYLVLASQAQQPGAKPSEQVCHFGSNKGVLLGEMTKAQLKWYAEEWKVQPDASAYDARLKLAAQALHAGNDSPDFSVPFA